MTTDLTTRHRPKRRWVLEGFFWLRLNALRWMLNPRKERLAETKTAFGDSRFIDFAFFDAFRDVLKRLVPLLLQEADQKLGDWVRAPWGQVVLR